MARIGRTSTMGGKKFTIVWSSPRKGEAQQRAKKLRDQGFLARVTSFSEGWYVWKGPRK